MARLDPDIARYRAEKRRRRPAATDAQIAEAKRQLAAHAERFREQRERGQARARQTRTKR